MTNQQVQYLLAFLGYYNGSMDGIYGPRSKNAVYHFQKDFGGIAVDGICGSQTQKALRHAVAYGLPKQDVQSNWDQIQFFQKEEFACKCGNCGGFPAEPAETLIRCAEEIRSHFGKPITVSSGVRCAAHNAAVGGVSNSRHLSGKAMDYTVQDIPANTVLAYVQQIPEIRYAYAINDRYVHMDVE